jgi:hypothetical protein
LPGAKKHPAPGMGCCVRVYRIAVPHAVFDMLCGAPTPPDPDAFNHVTIARDSADAVYMLALPIRQPYAVVSSQQMSIRVP